MGRSRKPPKTAPFQVRLPRFVTEREIGLGDAVSRTAQAIGLRPCGGCARRAAAINRWVTLTTRRT